METANVPTPINAKEALIFPSLPIKKSCKDVVKKLTRRDIDNISSAGIDFNIDISNGTDAQISMANIPAQTALSTTKVLLFRVIVGPPKS